MKEVPAVRYAVCFNILISLFRTERTWSSNEGSQAYNLSTYMKQRKLIGNIILHTESVYSTKQVAFLDI